VLTGAVTTLLGPVLPTLSARWAIDDAQAGYLFTAQFLGSMTGVALSGGAVRWLGFVRLLGVGYVFMAAGVAWLGVSAWPAGALSVFCYGIGQGITIPMTNLFISDERPHSRASSLNLLNFAWGVGAVVSLPVVGLLARGGRLTEALLALSALLAAVVVWLARCELASAASEKPGTASEAQAPAEVWRNPVAAILGATAFLYVGTESAVGGWIASYTLRVGSASGPLWAITPSIFWGALLLGRLTAPIILRRLSGNHLALTGLALAVAGITLLLSTQAMGALLSGIFMAGFGFATIFPNAVATMSECFGQMAARVAVLFFTMAALGGATVPWIVGQVSARSGSLRTGLVVALAGGLALTALQAAVILITSRASRAV
jgi:fucose permease